MRVFMIGGTGLLGSQAAKELISRGHEVSALALPPLPSGAELPSEMKLTFGNYLEMSDDELASSMNGCEGFVFAAGIDERVEGAAPIYDLFKRYNITPLERLLRVAKACGVRHAVICGSYFSYFAKIWPRKQLAKWHPYIRSRIDQENMALAFASDGFDVSILELPYIFGTQPGRKPVWVFLVELIRSMPIVTMFPKGGTAMVTVRQVGEAIAGAIEHSRGGICYPIGYENLTWKKLLQIVQNYMGCPNKRIITIPNWIYALGARVLLHKQKAAGLEGGLQLVKFSDVMCSETFISRSLGCDVLGVTADDIDAAIGDSIRLCLAILDGKTSVIGMKGE